MASRKERAQKRDLSKARSEGSYMERIAKNEDEILQFANDVHSKKIQISSESGWRRVAWGIDVVQQMLETPESERAAMGLKGGISIRFQMALIGLVQSMQGCHGTDGCEGIYERVEKVFEEYLKKKVLPSIKKKTGTEQLKEFVKRWECHKIFCEYMRRLFLPIDNGALQQGQGPKDSISALGLRQFKNYLWDIGKKDIVNTMLGLIHDHRTKGVLPSESKKFLERCKEILCVMGIVKAKNFPNIRFLVDDKKANRGMFKIMSVLPLLGDPQNNLSKDKQPEGVKVVEHLKFYHEEFQDPLLASTEAYCMQLRDEWIVSKSTPEYFKKFHELFVQETNRVADYLHESTKAPLQKACVKVMLDYDTQIRLLQNEDSGLFQLLKMNKLDDVALMYSCIEYVDKFKLKGGLSEMAKIFGTFIEKEGDILIRQRLKKIDDMKKKIAAMPKHKQQSAQKHLKSGHAPDYIDALRIKFVEIKKIRLETFRNEPRFTKSMTRAFETIVNHQWGKDERQTDDYMCHYMDMVFKGNRKKTRLTTDEIKFLCSEILEMFDFLHDKDIFLATYKRLMVDRLLDPNYSEYTNETDILATLKLKVGGSETQTMESMLNDVTKVKAETVKWHAYVDKHKKNVALKASLKAFQPKVMSNSAWELPQMHIDLKCVPHRVEVWAEEYGKYYAVLQNSRHLTYRHDLSLVEISAKYGKRKYRINMSAPQACVLYLFNTNDKLTIPQIQNLLQVKESSSIQSILMTLLQKPLRNKSNGGLLLKIPVEGVKPLPLTNKDEFKTNSNFMCKLVKFDLRKPDYGYVKPKAPPPRNFRLEAALVRTMKTKKIMETKELIQDSTLLVAKFFKPDVREVKKTIEKLIKTEYIERVEGTTKLKYKA